MLSRFLHLEAKQMNVKTEKKIMGGPKNEDISDPDVPVETLYRCPSESYHTPSTLETLASQPNPSVLNDSERKYKEVTVNLLTSRKITLEAVTLCSDPIRNFYHVVKNVEEVKEKLVAQLMHATENLLYTEIAQDGMNDPGLNDLNPKLLPTSFLFQVICKMLHVWNFHLLSKHLQNHFISVNEATVSWIEKLETTCTNFGELLKKFKEDFDTFHDYVDGVHGFSTWIQRKFHFNLPTDITTKWRSYIQDDMKKLSDPTNDTSSPLPPLQLNFTYFDVDILKLNPDFSTSYLNSLNKTSGYCQIGLVTTIFTRLNEIVQRAIVNLNCACSAFEKNMIVKSMRQSFASDKKLSNLRHITQLEDLVLALTFEKNHKTIKEIIAYVELLNRAISQFNHLFQIVQLQIEDKGIINVTHVSRKDRIRKKVWTKEELEHLSHDIWLNETKQILRRSVEAMPNTYEIQEESMKSSLWNWVKIADRDKRLMELFHNNTKRRAAVEAGQQEDVEIPLEEINVEGRQKHDETKQSRNDLIEKTPSDVALDLLSLPNDFEEAMTKTTFGKAFFPDPDNFLENIEGWRTVCFKMLATAINKFREMTTTKIIDANTTLSHPRISQQLISTKQTNTSISGDEESLTNDIVNDSTEPIEMPHGSDEKEEGNENEAKNKASVRHVGYMEGLCSILCFATCQLSPRDRVFVSGPELRLLKDKFFLVNSLVEKFKKDLDAAERVLVNSLSLAMASVEYKRLPQHLPVSPQDNDFLKAHDLEEVGMRKQRRYKDMEMDLNVFGIGGRAKWRKSERNVNASETDINLLDPFEIELHWDSINKTKLFCRFPDSDNSQWIELSQLHIAAQLRLIHILIDEIMKEFEKARVLIKDSKSDMTFAKKLLQKTWKGIGKDVKRGRIPDSGVLVLIKLYRHQIATAVMNIKAIRNTAREVRFLLSQSARHAKFWAKEEENYSIEVDRNRVMSMDNMALSVTLKPVVPKESWVMKNSGKNDQRLVTSPIKGIVEPEKFMDIKAAVEVKSSTSFDIPKDLLTQLSELAVNKSLAGSSYDTALGQIREKGEGVIASGQDFYSVASTIETFLLSGLEQSVALLKLPNCSLGPQSSTSGGIPNVIGLLAALISATVNINHFRDIVPVQRTYIMERIREVEEKINKVRNPNAGVANGILGDMKKIRSTVEQLDKNFRGKFCYAREFPAIDEIAVGSFHPIYGISPMEFVERLAEATSGHVWTVVSGIPEIGMMIRDNKTLESHVLSNIPLASRLEILISLIRFLEKLVENVQTNLYSIKKDISSAKSMLKSHEKNIMKRKRNSRKTQGSRRDLSKWELEENLQSFARIMNASKRAEDDVTLILDLLKRSNDLLQQASTYLILKMKLEPINGSPTVDNDLIFRSHNWHTVEAMTGLAPPPNVPPPIILKKMAKKTQKEEDTQMRYKVVWENRVLELELFFEQFCKNHHVAVDVPLLFIPANNRRRAAQVYHDDDE